VRKHLIITVMGTHETLTVQLLCESRLSHMADAMRLMLNEAMRIERAQALEADPYQRTEKRRGYANGFKPRRNRDSSRVCRRYIFEV
jgi:hypothetical protein